jgi:hypothetical protein
MNKAQSTPTSKFGKKLQKSDQFKILAAQWFPFFKIGMFLQGDKFTF